MYLYLFNWMKKLEERFKIMSLASSSILNIVVEDFAGLSSFEDANELKNRSLRTSRFRFPKMALYSWQIIEERKKKNDFWVWARVFREQKKEASKRRRDFFKQDNYQKHVVVQVIFGGKINQVFIHNYTKWVSDITFSTIQNSFMDSI